MATRHHTSITRPLSVQEIVSLAEEFEFDAEWPMQLWLRSANMLLTNAAACEHDGDIRTAYLYLYRHMQLITDRLPQHVEYRAAKYKPQLSQARKAVIENVPRLEQWKPRINQEHQRYVKAMGRRNAERKRIADEHRSTHRQPISDEHLRKLSIGSEEAIFGETRKSLDATENRQLAVELAQRELRRRDASRQTTRQAGISPGTVASRRKGLVLDETLGTTDADDVSRDIRETARHLQPSNRQSSLSQPSSGSALSRYQYPTVPSKEGRMDWATPPPARSLEHREAPTLPAKEPTLDWQSAYSNSDGAPPIPAKQNATTASSAARPPSRPTSPAEKVTFKSMHSTEAGVPLRTVLLPPELRTTFLNLAHSNTVRDLETGGVLCATQISNAYFITHLVIPGQDSTSDTCDTTGDGEVALWSFCESNQLVPVGWIHTHPSQSCFLSSRDLHTSSAYQQMVPEAIAIVCSPRHNPEWGVFRLTDPPGVKSVLGCRQQGLFHPHSETNLYTDAMPGHVVEGPGMKFELVDLRKG